LLRSSQRLWLTAGLLLLAVACRSLPVNVEREASFAFAQPEETALGRLFLADANEHSGESGFVPVTAGTDAFLLRSAFAGLAERTLDLQYYIWADDLTGRMLLRNVLKAAERGVRVRVLLDDIHAAGNANTFAIVDAHQRIEVRLFNPFANRDVRAVEFVANGAQLNRRMHNKVMVPDNALAITGGRNIGDHYFDVDAALNFRDLDLLATGPIVQDLSGMFDAYWNSQWAYPIVAVTGKRHTPEDVRELIEFLDRWISEQPELPYTLDADARGMQERIDSYQDSFLWGEARAVFDSPDKVNGEAGPHVAEVLFDSVDGTTRELLIETAYLIPGKSGIAIFESLGERGIDIRVLTNSLATNDIVAAHAHYAKYRAALLRAGVDLRELRPDAASEQQRMTVLAADSIATLHTKALVYDRRQVFVGSFNLDPRSLLINTEMGVLVRNRELAGQIAVMILEGMRPVNSYQLVLRDGEVHWKVSTPDGVKYLDADPQTSWWRRFVAKMIALLPVTEQL